MHCPECKKDGIPAFGKTMLVFDVQLRCRKCGTLFTLHKCLQTLLLVLSQCLVFAACIWAIFQLSKLYLWVVITVGFLALFGFTLVLPIKKVQQITRFKQRVI